MWARSQTSGDWSGETWRVSSSSSNGPSRASVRERACSRTSASSVGDTELGKAAEDERGDHRPLPDGRCDALGRPVAHVPGGEEPDPARLECKRVALERPAVRQAGLAPQVGPGEDEAAVVRDHVLARAPLGVGPAAQAEEGAVDPPRLVPAGGVREGDGLELA